VGKRIVIVGGGSYGWTPTIVRDIVVTKELEGSTIVLEDIDAATIRLTGRACRRIIKQSGRKFTLKTTTSEKEALSGGGGADFVILTISTGGFDAMEADVELPKKYGIHQAVGDTVGPGGLSRALRNIPVVVKLARNMERHCPGAWLLNYTNPMTTLTRAVTSETGVPTIGLCHELYGTLGLMQRIFGLKDWTKDIAVHAAGINHLMWVTEMDIRGANGFAMLRDYLRNPKKYAEREKKAGRKLDLTHAETHIGSNRVKFELFKIFGALPAAGDRHVAEFFPHFLTEKTRWGADWGVNLTTVEQRRTRWRPGAKKRCQAIASGKEKVKLVRSHEAVSLIMAGLAGARTTIDVVNLPNDGQIPELPLDAVVETMGVMDSSGARGLPAGELPPGVATILQRHVDNQEMTVEAALTGDKELAFKALVNDPLVLDLKRARRMFDEMLKANRKWLPQFFKPRGRKRR